MTDTAYKDSDVVNDFNKKPSNSFFTILKKIIKEQTLILIFLLIIIGMGIGSPVFLTTRNLLNILLQTSIIGIMAAGMTMIILMAEIDLSVGSIAAFAGVLAAKLQVMSGWQTAPAMGFTLITCFLLGLLVGFIVAELGVHSFVATLGLLSVGRGLALIISHGNPISGLSDSFNFLGQGRIGFISLPVLIMFAVMIIVWFVLSQMKLGRAVYAIGGNKDAANLSGIPVKRIKIFLFGISALLAGMAGIVLAGRIASGQPVAADGAELDVIASVIIGGTSMYGGRGGIGRTIIGTLILGILRNGMNLMQVTPYWQKVFIGCLIVVTVVLDRVQHRNE